MFTLTLSVQLSCNSTYKEKWQSLSDTCEMEIDVGCKDSAWCKPLSMGCWVWGGFLQRPCPDACLLLGRSRIKPSKTPNLHVHLLLLPSPVNTEV